jgi:TATA-box binding protein (TBP) (component of TFIID and TFIIIB)
MPCAGVIKKQMKFNSVLPEDVCEIMQEKAKYDYVDDYIISQVHATDGRNKFKDIRKVSIGICKKDITSYRCKRKSAFYNCFVVILRLLHNDVYKEIHVKVFNTGKLEIPGIQDSTILNKVLTLLVEILTPIVVVVADAPPLKFLEEKSETVMINSNFSCGYYINREKMYKLLKYKYKINSNFDPCSYPGIQCEFYYDSLMELQEQNGIQPAVDRTLLPKQKSETISKISFMIFRTGSVLIVGKCSEEMLYEIYHFLCKMFVVDYDEIKGANLPGKFTAGGKKDKETVRKIRKKTILV